MKLSPCIDQEISNQAVKPMSAWRILITALTTDVTAFETDVEIAILLNP